MIKRLCSVLCVIILLSGCTHPTESTIQSSLVDPSSASASSAASLWWETALKHGPAEMFITLQCVVNRDEEYISAYTGNQFSVNGNTDDYTLLFDSAVESKDIGKRLEDLSSYQVMISDDIGYTGEFYEKGISFKNLNGKQSVLLSIKTEDYSTLLARMRSSLQGQKLYSSILNEINPLNCTSIKVKSKDGIAEYSYTPQSKDIPSILRYIGSLMVTPGTAQKIDKRTTLPEAATAVIRLKDGLSVSLQTDGKTLLVTTSDMDGVISYATKTGSAESYLSALESIAKGNPPHPSLKPVIYLYPEKPTDVSVQLTFQGRLTYTYPVYNKGWNVTAYPDGRILNKADGSEHYYLFWEGVSNQQWDFSKGFVVAGKDTEAFLKKSLVQLGLTPKEYNDFLVFWVPRMQDNAYNLITFATAQYEELAPLKINPQPDSILRVHMVYKPLENPVAVQPQQLSGFTRKGFTVVEWGGTEVK